jgi:hypothetical protein
VNDCHYGYITKSLKETLVKKTFNKVIFNGGNFGGSAWDSFISL